MFYCIFKKEFSKFGVLSPQFFFEKISKISEKFPEILSTFSKWIKTFIFVPKLVQNHYIDQNLAKSSLKTPKTVYFFSETTIFHNFLCFWCRKFRVYVPKIPDLLQLFSSIFMASIFYWFRKFAMYERVWLQWNIV